MLKRTEPKLPTLATCSSSGERSRRSPALADPRQVERQAFAFHQRRQHLLDRQAFAFHQRRQHLLMADFRLPLSSSALFQCCRIAACCSADAPQPGAFPRTAPEAGEVARQQEKHRCAKADEKGGYVHGCSVAPVALLQAVKALDADDDAAIPRIVVRGGLRGAGGAHGHAAGGDAVAGEEGGDGLGAGEAEHEVVRLAAAAVGMAFDDEPCIRMMAEPVTKPGDASVRPGQRRGAVPREQERHRVETGRRRGGAAAPPAGIGGAKARARAPE